MTELPLLTGNILSPKTGKTPAEEILDNAISKVMQDFGIPMVKNPIDQKQERLEQTAQAKKVAFGDIDFLRDIAAADYNGNKLAEDPVIQDLMSLDFGSLERKYGTEVARNRWRLIEERRAFNNTLNTTRTAAQRTGDALLDAGSGFVTGAGSLAALGAGLVNDNAGVALAQAAQRASEGLKGMQSEELQERRESRSRIDRQNMADSLEQYNRESSVFSDKNDGFAGLRMIGRDWVNAMGNLLDDPAMVGSVTAEGLGSLALSGPLAKSAQVITKGSKLAPLAVPATIGAVESSSTYTQAVDQVMGMNEAELYEGSAEYRRLRDQGISHEDAQKQVANSIGLEAAAIQFPTAAIAGKFVEKFEASPLKAGSVRQGLANIGKETLEEAVQSGTSELAINKAIQNQADDSRNLGEGVGQAAASGMVGGFGMAGVVQAPGMVRNAAVGTGKGIATTVSNRLDRIDAERDKASPVGRTSVAEAATRAKEKLSTLNTRLDEAIASQSITNPDTAAGLTEAKDRVRTTLLMTGAEINETPASVNELLFEEGQAETLAAEGEFDRIGALGVVLENLRTRKLDETATREAALWLYEQARAIEALRSIDPDQIPKDLQDTTRDALQNVETILEDPILQKALEQAQTVSSADLGPLPEVTEQNISSPEVQDAVRKTALIAQANPAGVDPKFVGALLDQKDRGKIDIREAVEKRLRAAKLLAEEATLAAETKAIITERANAAIKAQSNGNKVKARKTSDIVRKEIRNEGISGDNDKRLGLSGHLARINASLESGNVREAQLFLDNLRNFGEHMHNKVRALNESAKLNRSSNNRIPHRTWTGSTWLEANHPRASAPYINPHSPNSVLMGRDAVIDVQLVTNLYNNLLAIYGKQLTGEKLPKLEVHPLLRSIELDSIEPKAKSEVTTRTKTLAKVETVTEKTSTEKTNTEKTSAEKTSEERYAGLDLTPEPEEVAPKKERRIRKDAIAKTKDSLIDYSDEEMSPVVTRISKETSDVTEPKGTDRQEAPESTAGTREGAQESNDPEVLEKVDEGAAEEGVEEDPEAEDDRDEVAEADDAAVLSFPNLVKAGGIFSRFDRAYKILPAKSRLISQKSPARYVLDLLEGKFEIPDVDLPYRMDNDNVRAWHQLITSEAGHIVKVLNRRLTEKQPTIRGGRLTPLEALDPKNLETVKTKGVKPNNSTNRTDVTGWPETRMLNLVDPSTGKYDPQLLQTAALAAIHWVLNSGGDGVPDLEKIAKQFRVHEDEVTIEMIKSARAGISAKLAKESLARTILEFWSVEIRKEAPLSDSYGIVQSLAAEILGIIKDRLTTETSFDIVRRNREGEVIEKLPNVISIRPGHPNTKELVDKLGPSRSFLADAFLPKKARTFVFGNPVEKTRRTQKGNPLGRLSKRMRDVLKRHQEIQFYQNTPFVLMLEAFGRDFTMELLGYKPVEEAHVNQVDLLSIEGKNTQIARSWDNIENFKTQLAHYIEQEKAAGRDATPENIKVFFDWYVVLNERIHADGFNPQADKLMREVVSSTVSTLDLTKAKDRELFWLTVAQSSDLVKTEKGTRAANVKTVQEKIFEKYGNTIEILRHWLDNGEPLDDIQKEVIRKELGQDATPKILHALLAVARYDESLTKFVHNLSLEADGKTDGPINGMIHFTSGLFSVPEIRNLRKGGFFPNEKNRTLNTMDTEPDLYTTAAERFAFYLMQHGTNLKGTPAEPHMQALLRLMKYFKLEVEYVEKDGQKGFIIGRNVLKNPLTVTVYGSGNAGIASKVVNSITEVLYAKLTELAQARQDNLGDMQMNLNSLPGLENYTRLYDDLELLFSKRVFQSKRNNTWYVFDAIDRNGKFKAPIRIRNADSVKFELSFENLRMMKSNVEALFVEPMSWAIDELMGKPKKTMKLFQQATQIQSLVLMERFRSTVKKRIEERRNSGDLGPGEFLSLEDYNAIFKELSRFGAVIEPIDTDAHHLNLSSSESWDSGASFARSLEGKYSSTASLHGPSDAGVSVAAMITISRGDALMMVNYFASQDADLRVLPVFDGLEMPADGIDTISRIINRSVAEGWLTNPTKDVADSFADFLRQDKKGILNGITDPEVLERLNRILDGKTLEELSEELQEVATSIQARKNTFKRMTFSVDHMASGERPYTHEGEIFDVEDDDQLVLMMNEIYREELAKLATKKNDKDRRQPVEEPSAAFRKAIEAFGVKMGDSNVIRMPAKNAARMLMENAKSPDARQVAQALYKFLPNYSFYFGSAEELTRLRNQKFPERAGSGPIQLGQADLDNRAVFIANQAVETTLHEMLHAVVGSLVQQYYRDPSKMNETQQAALQNLESLMRQFLGMSFEAENKATRIVASELQADLERLLSQGTAEGKADALNEFIAWSLSNQNLIDVMRASKVRTPLRKLIHEALKALKRLLGLPVEHKLDMFSNIYRNVGALLLVNQASRLENNQIKSSGLLNQVIGQASDPRLERLIRDINTKIGVHLAQLDPLKRPTEQLAIVDLAVDAVNRFTRIGFNWTPQQQSAFRSIQAIMASSMQLDNKALVRIEKLFVHVTKQLEVEHFMDDPIKNDPRDRHRAQEQFNLLMGTYGHETDQMDRSNLLASFLALSQVDDRFRKILKSINLPKDREVSYASTDELLESVFNSLLNTLSTTISGEGFQNRTVIESLDRLSVILAKINEDDRTFIEKKANEALGTADRKVKSFLSKAGEYLTSYAESKIEEEVSTFRKQTEKTLRQSAGLIASLVDEQKGKAVASALTSLGNQTRSIPLAVLEVMNEVIGITDENRAVYEMINRVKYMVSALRQDYREKTPEIIAEQFSRKLTDQEWSQLHLALGKTDVSVLTETFSTEDIRRLFTDDAYFRKEIDKAENALRSLAPGKAKDFMRRAEDLALFMVKGEIRSDNFTFARNAEAIAMLSGERNNAKVVAAIDRLTSLYALRQLDDSVIKGIAELAKTESRGMDFLILYLADVARKERAKATTDEARLNGYKGYIPTEKRDGASLIVANDREHNKLMSLGYTRIGDYRGSGVEGGKRGYYYSTVAGNNTYSQGVMQTVQMSAQGVDPRTGRTLTGTTAGMITGNQVAIIQSRLQGRSRFTGEPLMPIWDAAGNVVAYERHMLPERLSALGRNSHLGEMLGAWAGRQAEEEMAQGFNKLLVDRVKMIWDRDRSRGRADEFVDLSDPELKDPIWKDAWAMVPAETRDYIKEVFGEDGFMVRRDMINNVMGYRDPSIGDVWTGLSRLDPNTREIFRKTAEVIIGKDAFKYLSIAESAWQSGVSAAKNIIVIKSVVVPLANIGSNFLQLMAYGVGARDIYRGFTSKLVEINQHLKNLERKVEIEALMAVHAKNPIQIRKLQTELKSLEDSSRRMSIWPLIEAGEFTTISEGLTEADAAISQGKWIDQIQNLMDKVPAKLGTLGRYALITRDTALFQGMARAIQYGDFLAKAVFYDHLTKREGMKKDQALNRITEAFVNYNLLPGRMRSGLESMGLTWFWAYKLRSIKEAYRMLRDNPVRTLLASVGAEALPDMPGMEVGSPIRDNALNVIFDGRAGYSIGPGMLFNAPSLNPWVNLVN